MGLFNCMEIDEGEYWLVYDLDTECWNSDHGFLSLFVALPGIVIWVIISPALCLWYMIKNK